MVKRHSVTPKSNGGLDLGDSRRMQSPGVVHTDAFVDVPAMGFPCTIHRSAIAGATLHDTMDGNALPPTGATQTVRTPDGRNLTYVEVGDPQGKLVLHNHSGP